jgi:hypothetical protein
MNQLVTPLSPPASKGKSWFVGAPLVGAHLGQAQDLPLPSKGENYAFWNERNIFAGQYG